MTKSHKYLLPQMDNSLYCRGSVVSISEGSNVEPDVVTIHIGFYMHVHS